MSEDKAARVARSGARKALDWRNVASIRRTPSCRDKCASHYTTWGHDFEEVDEFRVLVQM